MPRSLALIPSVLSVLLVPLSAHAASPTYWEDVRPVLRKACVVCHNPRLQEVDAQRREIVRNEAEILVLGPAGQHLVANQQDGGGGGGIGHS